jgi:hypothetical protein
MNTKFKFTDARIRALPTNPSTAKSTKLEFSDTEITGLKCLSSKKAGSKRFLLRYVFQSRKRSISLERFLILTSPQLVKLRKATELCW